MKKILILSDSHGLLENDVLKYIEQADEVWHAGDWGSMEVFEQLEKTGKIIRGVYGNIDGGKLRTVLKEETVFVCDGVKIFMTHIGGYPGRYSMGIIDKLKLHHPHLFICGHSHILKIIQDKELQVLHINPGACGRHGFHIFRTMVRIEINEGKITKADVIELGRRTT
ncbi:MAG: metallophosphatase family protein [Bacteroidia bacterium]|nr:metallophosphatase family protein [Bacteroidia bacterium]